MLSFSLGPWAPLFVARLLVLVCSLFSPFSLALRTSHMFFIRSTDECVCARFNSDIYCNEFARTAPEPLPLLVVQPKRRPLEHLIKT